MYNIPKESTCRYCGRRILRAWPEGKEIIIESRRIPYKRKQPDGKAPWLWTAQGIRIYGDPLPEDREDEADGWGHMGHVCPARPMPKRRRPLTRREKYREAME